MAEASRLNRVTVTMAAETPNAMSCWWEERIKREEADQLRFLSQLNARFRQANPAPSTFRPARSARAHPSSGRVRPSSTRSQARVASAYGKRSDPGQQGGTLASGIRPRRLQSARQVHSHRPGVDNDGSSRKDTCQSFKDSSRKSRQSASARSVLVSKRCEEVASRVERERMLRQEAEAELEQLRRLQQELDGVARARR